MALLDLKESLQEVTGSARVSELVDGVLLIDGDITVLIVHRLTSKRAPGQDGAETQLEKVRSEFNSADYVLVSIEGTVLSIQGRRSAFDISYLPEYVGGIQLPDFASVVSDIYHGTLRTEPLPMSYLSENERQNVVELLRNVYSTNLTVYYTPKKVAELAANWACAGERTTLIDITSGSGEHLIAGADEIEDGSQAWGIDTNGLACAITQSRASDYSVPRDHIICTDFFDLLGDFSLSGQQPIHQSPLEESLFNPPASGFDCVLAHPPIGNETHQQSSGDSSDVRRREHQFVRSACNLLAESGRGCFILPSHGLRELRKNVLPDGIQIKRLAKLPESAFQVIGVEPMLVCVERTSENEGLGIVNFSDLDRVEEQYGVLHSTSTAERFDSVEATTVDPELPTTTIQTLLSAPGAAPFFTEEYPTLQEVTENIATGMVTGNNDVFYFTESERAESAISDRFFTPVIKSLPDNSLTVSEEDIERYLFDLRGFINSHQVESSDFEEIINLLESVDTAAASYVLETLVPAVEHQNKANSVLPRSIPMESPDLVTGAITSPVLWYSVDIDDEILFNNSIIGVRCGDGSSVSSLQTLLNTPLYQRLSENQFPNLDAEYVRVQIRPLRRLPIIHHRIPEETFDQLSSLSLYETHESRRTARTIILEALSDSDRKTVAATYEAVSPLSKLDGYSEEIEQLKAVLNGENTIYEAIDENMILQLETTFRTAELFESREQLIEELLFVYSDKRYWSFMGGAASQFEGILQDYVKNTGGEVAYREDDNGDLRLHFKYRGNWKLLRLKILIDEFFSGDLLNVMQEVRKQRNEIAHGRLLENPKVNAETLLLALFVFTYALLHEYNNYLGAEKVKY